MTTKPAAANLVNESVLGRYRIVRRLARGGMGAVYLGRTEGAAGFARPVVIKRVLPSLMDDEEVAQMFVREAQILSNLAHPNIVSVLDFGQQDDGAYLMVLEYVNGYSLGEWHDYVKQERGAIPADFAIHIVTRVLDALHYAHTFKRSDGKALQIIHRDVTPSNVLLDVQGNVKLLDFGIARVSGDETAFMTERSRVKGKLPYLPLESFKGAEPSVQSDVYSAGVVLYELLTGHNPFLGKETADIYLKVLEVVPPSVHATCDDAPEDIDAILAKAMHRDASKRYASAAQFAQALRKTRGAADEATSERLSAQLRADFEASMPERLGLETLDARDRAWRNLAATEVISNDEMAEDASKFELREPVLRPDQVTMRADVAPELIAASVGSLPAAEPKAKPEAPPAPLGKRPAPPPLLAPPAIVAPPTAAAAPVALVPSVAASLPYAAADLALADAHGAETRRPPPAPADPSAAISFKRVALVVGVAALAGAIAAAAVLVLMQPPPPEEMVVIRQETHAPAPAVKAVPPPSPAPPVAPAPAEPETPAPPPVTEAPPVAEKKETRPVVAVAPSAKSLTRAFGRRQSRVEACFTKHADAAAATPQLSIHFWVDEKGAVTNAEVDPQSVRSTPLGRCLLDVARGTGFGPMQRAVSFHIPITAQKL